MPGDLIRRESPGLLLPAALVGVGERAEYEDLSTRHSVKTTHTGLKPHRHRPHFLSSTIQYSPQCSSQTILKQLQLGTSSII